MRLLNAREGGEASAVLQTALLSSIAESDSTPGLIFQMLDDQEAGDVILQFIQTVISNANKVPGSLNVSVDVWLSWFVLWE